MSRIGPAISDLKFNAAAGIAPALGSSNGNFRSAISQISGNLGASRSNFNAFSRPGTNLSDFIATKDTSAQASNATKYATGSESTNYDVGTVNVAGETKDLERQAKYEKDPNWIYDDFKNLPEDIFGKAKEGEEGYEQYFGRDFKNDKFSFDPESETKKYELPAESKTLEILNNELSLQTNTKEFTDFYKNEYSIRLSHAFADTEHLDKATAYSLRKLNEAGFQDLATDAKALATVTAYNLSVDGLQGGLGKLLADNQAHRDLMPKGLAKAASLAAWKAGEKISLPNYISSEGGRSLSGNEVEHLGHLINQTRAHQIMEDFGVSKSGFDQYMKDKHGFYGVDNKYQLHGAALAAGYLDSNMFEMNKETGQTFFEDKVDAFYEKNGFLPKFTETEYIVNNSNADHGALHSSVQGELTGTAALLKHYAGGFTTDPTKANHLIFTTQSDKTLMYESREKRDAAFERLNEKYAEQGGVDLLAAQRIQRGHGGTNGATLLDQEKQILVGAKDSAKDLEHYDRMSKKADLVQVDSTCDSCFQELTADAHLEQAKKDIDGDTAVKFTATGSRQEGQVLAGRLDHEQGYETFVPIGNTGVLMPVWKRHDLSGTQDTDKAFVGAGKEKFEEKTNELGREYQEQADGLARTTKPEEEETKKF